MRAALWYHARMNGTWYKTIVLLLLGALQVFAMPRLDVSGSASVSAYQAGKSFDVALQGKVGAPWHAYYRNPATVGDPMQASLQAPHGFKVEGPYWQVPTLHSGDIGTAYIYEKPVVVWRVTPTAEAPVSARFVLKAEAQLCSDSGCMPAQEVETAVELEQGEPTPNPAWQNLEKQVETLGDTPLQEVKLSRVPGGAALSFRCPAEVTGAYFFSDDNAIMPDASQTFTREDDRAVLHLVANDGKNPMYPAPEGGLQSLAGILTLSNGTHARVDVSVAEAQSAGVPAELWSAALGLFLGGLLLNLMPCVFPVLGLKVMSFVSLGGGNRGRVVGHSLAFVAGILISFWVLGLLLVVVSNAEALARAPWQDWLRILWNDTGATDRNWASWMENEWIVYGIMILLLVLGLWMYGVFELGTRAGGVGNDLQSKGGYTGSFFQGLFVTLVATPCSAPYLGTAMPVAMSFPAVWMLVALTAMALGLALPYFILSVFPSLVKILPRPGAWMESLKQGLSFLLFAAAAWMLDVYLSFVISGGRADDTLKILVALVVFSAGFWVFGRWGALYRSRLSRCVGLVVALALGAAGVWYSMPHGGQDEKPEWVAWSPEAMAEALESGSPVYVDFTAKWCATCQANKAVAYTDEVYKLISDREVVLMRADKTHPNAEIDAELRRLKRSAVPTNALYLPGKEPKVTRELLTPDYLLHFLDENLPQESDEDAES